MLMTVLLIALLGAVGTVARYGMQELVYRFTGAGFPWGTAAVNLLGTFLIGVLWTLAEERGLVGSQTRSIIAIGFLGGFTTFSSYMYETGSLIRDSQWVLAIANVVGQNVLGIAGLFLGFAVGRIF